MTEDPTRLTFRNASTEAAERQATALERIAESLDQIAALLAAPAALRGTGVTSYDLPHPMNPDRARRGADGP